MSSFSSRWSSYVPPKEPAEEKSLETPRKLTDKTDRSPEPIPAPALEVASVPSAEIVPRLPWQLERLISAAASNQLPQGTVKLPSGLVPDLNRYTLGWAAAYLAGDRQEALSRLWQVRRVWQGENAS